MRQRFQKIVALLILSTFLAVSLAGNVFGCIEFAVGERSQIVTTPTDRWTDLISNPGDSAVASALYQSGDEQQGLCDDCTIQQESVVFSKRTKRIPAAATITAISNVFPLTAVKSVRLAVGKLSTQPLTTTSQTLLAHRTVVLLN